MLEGEFRIKVAVTFAVPPGTLPEQARAHLAQNGLSVALGLMQWVRNVDVDIVTDVAAPKITDA